MALLAMVVLPQVPVPSQLVTPAQPQTAQPEATVAPITPPPALGADRRRPANDAALPAELRTLAAAAPLVTTMALAGAQVQPRRDNDTGSGMLVSACLVLTAQHLLATTLPGATTSITLRFVGAGGTVKRQARLVAAGGQLGRQRSALLDDWALLQLAEPMVVPPLTLLPGACCARPRMAAASIGYPADHFRPDQPVPWIDPACMVVARMVIGMLAVDCQATSGNSGGPLLVKTAEGWRLAGIITRAPSAAAGGALAGKRSYAIPVEQFLARQIAEAGAATACQPATAAPPATSSPPPQKIPLASPPPLAMGALPRAVPR
ncbi:MAG: trypsin-like peptidase domain-containing protein [Sphingomonadales bacterium]